VYRAGRMAAMPLVPTGASLRAQMLEPAVAEMRRRLLALSMTFGADGCGVDEASVRQCLLDAAAAASVLEERRVDLKAVLCSQEDVFLEMGKSSGLRFGELLRCQAIAKRLPKANREAAGRFKREISAFNKVKKSSKAKVGVFVGLPKVGLGWLDDEKNHFHMSAIDMDAFPVNFERLMGEICLEPEILQFACRSRKSVEDYVKIVLLQPILADVQLNMSLDGLLTVRFGASFDFTCAEHSEFLVALKEALLIKMKTLAVKTQM